MTRPLPEFTSLKPKVMDPAEYAGYIDRAESPADLRALEDAFIIDGPMRSLSKEEMIDIARTTLLKLGDLGLDVGDTHDPRIGRLQNGVQTIHDSHAFGRNRFHPVDKPETTFFSAYRRILSATDMGSESRMQLLPQTDIVPADLFDEVAAAALLFTAGEEFDQHHTSFPRKAGRRISDVESRFWNCGIATHDYPGREFGNPPYGPNVSLWIPTGTVSELSVVTLPQNAYMENDTWALTTAAGYVPSRMVVQSVQFGSPSFERDKFDTGDHLVRDFLLEARRIGEAEAEL